jgi:hypothetical protein
MDRQRKARLTIPILGLLLASVWIAGWILFQLLISEG